MKQKGERERYTQLNAEFQRMARRPSSMNSAKKKKRGNNKMRKIRDLFKKTGHIKGVFHARMSMIKDRNGK